jgi:hypothetical protein
MSHVEPRRNYNIGGFPSFGITQMPPQSQIDKFKQAEIDRQLRKREPSIFAGDRFSMPENFPGGFPEYRKFLEQQKQEQKELQSAIESPDSGIATIKPGQSAFDAVFAPVDLEMAKQKAEKQKLLEDKPDPGKDEPAYEGTDIKSEVKKESEMLRELLKDDKYSRGEAALIIAGALAEPGSISDKIKKATELAAPVARKRREEDKAITLASYKLAKEKEREQIKAGKGTEYIRNIEATAESMSKQPGETRSKQEIKDALLSIKSPGSTSRIQQLEKISPNILDAAGDISRLQTELAAATSDKDKKRIMSDIERKLSDIRTISDYPEFDTVFPGLRKRLNLKEGGRAKFAEGTEVEDDIVTSEVSFGSGSETVTEPVQQLSYQELRDRLPPEITDDVVNLISNNTEALQEFAYIRTQDDVNGFNTKYGVNLVIPPTRT